MPAVGTSVPRKAAIPRGRVRSITLDFDTTGFTIVDYRDVPDRNVVDLIAQDQPFLVEKEIRHLAESILLLAHEDKDTLNAARVVIEYDEEAPQFDAEQSTQSPERGDHVRVVFVVPADAPHVSRRPGQ